MAEPKKIMVITAGGPYPWVIINALAERFEGVEVALEQPESKALFLRRRARKLGWWQTFGQFLTMTVSRFGKRFARDREAEIVAEHGITTTPSPKVPVTAVSSANGDDCRDLIAATSPDVVFLASCRMLSRKTLAAIPCPVLNYHSGINPKYRGLAGGWWARASGDEANYGTTVHLVDAGVDTGDILYQAFLTPDPRDSLLTDAMIMAAGSRDIAIKAVEDALNRRLEPKTSDLPSVQRYHPPIWTYLRTGVTRRIW
ncbi:formyl transferase [Hoeflea sp.]|uniref:formyl transferase n=1 Tax=Hoeflea sp. TaxID=1940281 RepID=UPI003BB10544